VTNYCGVPQSVGELFNYDPSFQGIPLGEFGARDPRVPNVPTSRSWVSQSETSSEDEDEVQSTASSYDYNSWGIVAPASSTLRPVRALRGVDNQIDHSYQTYNRDIEQETLRINNSLGREMVNDWNDARFNVGGIGYAYDTTNPDGIHWASSPGYKGDAYDPKYNPQIYMRPGVKLVSGFSNLGAVPPGQLPRSLYGST
jgi:hypothetical protein